MTTPRTKVSPIHYGNSTHYHIDNSFVFTDNWSGIFPYDPSISKQSPEVKEKILNVVRDYNSDELVNVDLSFHGKCRLLGDRHGLSWGQVRDGLLKSMGKTRLSQKKLTA